MGVKSGILAAINGISTARSWQVTHRSDTKPFVASNTKGGPGRLDGNKDWSGSFTAYGHTPSLVPGESFTFLGSIDGAKGVSGTALVDSITLTVDVEGGSIIGYSVAFSGDDELTLDADAVVEDTAAPDAYSSVERAVMVCVPGEEETEPTEWDAIANVRTATITLTAGNKNYVSSSTGGWNKRLPGNFDATLAIAIYEADMGAIIEPNTHYAVRVYVTAALYWEFRWMLFGEASNIDVNREDPGIVNYTANAAFSGWEVINDEVYGDQWTEGEVLDPADDTVWPAA